MFAQMLRRVLVHPLTRGCDIDDPGTTHLRREIMHQKTFLRRIYTEWYESLVAALPVGSARVLELGSGAGFLQDFIPDLITSEVFPCPGVERVVDAHDLAFRAGELRAILMIDVLHHLARPRDFFAEATRCVAPGGVIAMIEPWVTPWSRFVYRHFHYEPFMPEAVTWEFPSSGPLSGANNALPWILFERDRSEFALEFPEWKIERIVPTMPFRYLLSGGVTLRGLMPGWSFPLWRALEGTLNPLRHQLAMFAYIVLRRR
jgi:SAM-dependent methyltransferase